MEKVVMNGEEKIWKVYKALKEGKGEQVQEMIREDLEWWFHGPPKCQHLMRILTGEESPTSSSCFIFSPRSVTQLSNGMVVAEGQGSSSPNSKDCDYWVHVWTLDGESGIITQLREYFNTSLLLRHFASKTEIKAIVSTVGKQEGKCENEAMWQSSLLLLSMPGLVLAV